MLDYASGLGDCLPSLVQGAFGPAGDQGLKGSTGGQGQSGPKGSRGPKGKAGATGSIGPAGGPGLPVSNLTLSCSLTAHPFCLPCTISVQYFMFLVHVHAVHSRTLVFRTSIFMLCSPLQDIHVAYTDTSSTHGLF